MNRRRPPGSLSIASSIRSLVDRSYYLRAAERFGPIFVTRQHHRPTVCVVGLELGSRLLREHGSSLRGAPHRYSKDVTGGFLRFMEGDAHRHYSGVFRRALGPAVVAAAEPAVRSIAKAELLAMADSCSTGGAVLPRPHFSRVANDSVACALFGLVPGEPAHEEFSEAYRPIASHNMSRRLTPEGRAAVKTLQAFLGERADRVRSGDLAAGGSLGAMVALDAELPDLTCLDNLIFTQRIGAMDTTGLLCWMLALVGSHGIKWSDDDDLVERLMYETLRLAQSEFLYRVISEDIEFEGYVLRRGWLLRICVWESHRDPSVFPEPDRFDPERFNGRQPTHTEFAPFGLGVHHCVGVGLVTMICRAVFGELAAGFDWEVVWDKRATRQRMHWHHWRPSPSLGISLRPV